MNHRALSIALQNIGQMSQADRATLAAAATALPVLIAQMDDISFYSDGSVMWVDELAYIAGAPKPAGNITYNMFFNDTDTFAAANGIVLSQAALDNIFYNRMISSSPLWTGSAYSSEHSGLNWINTVGLPYAASLRDKIADRSAVVERWKTQGYVPNNGGTFPYVPQ